jgi:hypothetical protein
MGFAALLSLSLLLSCRGLFQPSFPQQCATVETAASRPHVVLIMLDNMKFDAVIGNPVAPFLNRFIPEHAFLSNYYGSTFPSIGNYLMITGGEIVTNDNRYLGTVSGDNIVRQCCLHGVSWKSYLDGLPHAGYLGDAAYPYVRPHNPLSYYDDVFFSEQLSMNLVPLEQLFRDLENDALPSFSLIVPSQVNNMHDCPLDQRPCGVDPKVQAGDEFLQRVVPPILANPTFAQNGLLIITTDHSWKGTTEHGGGHVIWVAAGPLAKDAYRSDDFYQHPSTLRLISDVLRIGRPNAAADAPDMSEVLVTPPQAIPTGP